MNTCGAVALMRWYAGPTRSSRAASQCLVCFEIPPARDGRRERAVVLLHLVLEFDPGEVERELIGRQVARTVRAAGVERADDEVLERQDVDLLLFPPLPADEQLRLVEVLAVRAGLHQLGACLAHPCRGLEVPEADLSGAGAAAVRGRTVVAGAPGEVLDLDRARTLAVEGLALDALDVQKLVGCHGVPSPGLTN